MTETGNFIRYTQDLYRSVGLIPGMDAELDKKFLDVAGSQWSGLSQDEKNKYEKQNTKPETMQNTTRFINGFNNYLREQAKLVGLSLSNDANITKKFIDDKSVSWMSLSDSDKEAYAKK